MPVDTRNAKLLAAAKAAIKAGDLPKAQNYLLMAEGEEAERLLDRVNKAIAARGTAPKAEAPQATSKAVAEGIKQADAAKKQEKAKQQGISLIIFLVLIFSCCAWVGSLPKTEANQQIANNDTNGQESLIAETIRSITDIDLQSVRVLHREDGYNMIMVTYNSHGDLYSEYGKVFGAVGSLVQQQAWDFDELALVIGDRQGNALQTVSVAMSNVVAYLNGQISVETFSQRMTITDF